MFAACGATALLLPAACGKTPTAPAVSFSAPLPTQANGASYGFGLQPITLTLTNAARTGQSVVTYTVEVATDSGFGSKVFTKDGVPEGANGKTNVELGSLAGGQTYYWHSMAVIDGVVGAQSPTQTFSVRPQIFTGVPTIASPNANDNVFGSRPSFTVNNVGHTSAAGTVFYEFQVASSAAFTTILASGSSQETPGRHVVVAGQRSAGRQSVLARPGDGSVELGSHRLHVELGHDVQPQTVRSQPRDDPEQSARPRELGRNDIDHQARDQAARSSHRLLEEGWTGPLARRDSAWILRRDPVHHGHGAQHRGSMVRIGGDRDVVRPG